MKKNKEKWETKKTEAEREWKNKEEGRKENQGKIRWEKRIEDDDYHREEEKDEEIEKRHQSEENTIIRIISEGYQEEQGEQEKKDCEKFMGWEKKRRVK
jgi:hypothetical protein